MSYSPTRIPLTETAVMSFFDLPVSNMMQNVVYKLPANCRSNPLPSVKSTLDENFWFRRIMNLVTNMKTMDLSTFFCLAKLENFRIEIVFVQS